MVNKSEEIRVLIRQLFDSNHDFSNRELNKQEFVKYFETEEKKSLDINWKKHQTLFIDQLDVVAKEKKIDVRTYGYGGKKLKQTSTGSDNVKSTITPKPKQLQQTQSNQQTQSTQNLEQNQNGLKIVGDNSQLQNYTPEGDPIIRLTEDEATKLTKILWKTAGNMAHKLNDKFEIFDETELLELADAWMPIAKPHLEAHGGRLFTAGIVTLGVLSKRADAFGKPKRDKTTKEKEESKEESSKGEDDEDFKEWQKRNQK